MTAKTREAFEALMARTHPHLHLTRWNIDGAYVSGVASDCWLTWQAGCKQTEVAALPSPPVAAPEGYKLACIGDSSSAPYPGMIAAFERHYGQSFSDKDWRDEASGWAAAWKASKAHSAAQEPTK